MTSRNNIQGILIPIGGNEDKGFETKESYGLDFINEGILSHVVRESGGPDSSIVIIPTASGIPDEVGENYLKAFGKLGCSDLFVMDIRKREESEMHDNIRRIEEADCIMFSGGDQSKIIDKIGGTTIHQILLERYRKEKFVIAGTSAGAMCMSSEMISGGSSTESLFKDAVSMREGMGFIPSLIIDSHFIRRGRFGRLAEAVARFPRLIGIGLAEDTGVIIENGNEFRVIGSGMVVVYDASELMHNNEKILEAGTPMTITNLKVHILANSDEYKIQEAEVFIQPVDADFI